MMQRGKIVLLSLQHSSAHCSYRTLKNLEGPKVVAHRVGQSALYRAGWDPVDRFCGWDDMGKPHAVRGSSSTLSLPPPHRPKGPDHVGFKKSASWALGVLRYAPLVPFSLSLCLARSTSPLAVKSRVWHLFDCRDMGTSGMTPSFATQPMSSLFGVIRVSVFFAPFNQKGLSCAISTQVKLCVFAQVLVTRAGRLLIVLVSC